MVQVRDIGKWALSELYKMIGKYRPKSLDWLLLRVYEDDAFACEPLVVSHVHRRRQNLPDGYLNKDLEGFEDRSNALKSLQGGFLRWTASQQEKFQEILIKEICHEDTKIEDKVNCVQQLSLLNYVDQKPLFDLANSDKSAIQEAALRASGDLDGDQGLPSLIEALSDERARIAVYSLHKILKAMPSKTYQLLSTIPDTKVTVAKEAIRLIDRDEAWTILIRAAENTDPKIAKSLVQAMLRLLNHESAEVRIAALKRLDGKPLQDQGDILAPRLLELVHSDLDDECTKAAKAILETYARTNVAKIGYVYRKILSDRPTLKRVHDTYLEIVSPSRIRNTYVHGLPWDELRSYVFEIMPELHADALYAAEVFIETNSTGWKEPGDDLLKVELGLKASKDEKARRLALSFLVGGVDESTGWIDEERFWSDG
ncbi:uncharacterized protein RAG0_02068 [Rhynchosporium agropyri]|uniref:HEAT repeat domain-containing protein n=1 Tax=Rhynchosporium agropyri TaxID=914238 RepID=A0A1E1K4F5_9HELO|nr:uncharacterized protein RAG0_02068 [Rhynchosporium agropyri]